MTQPELDVVNPEPFGRTLKHSYTMTQPDLEETPPSFLERLNRTFCFFWALLNAFWCIAFLMVVLGGSDNFIERNYFPTQICFVCLYLFVGTLIYLISGKLLNPFSKSVFSKTRLGFIFLAIPYLFLIPYLIFIKR